MSMSMSVAMFMPMSVSMRTPSMSSMRVIVQDLHDDEVADETEDTGEEHEQWFIDRFLVKHALGSLNEKFGSYDIDDRHVDECSQGLSLFPPECELFGRVRTGAQPDSSQGDEIGEDVREEMEGIGEDGDGVGEVAANKLDGHE